MQMNGYELSRAWHNWCYENPEKYNSNHTAMFFWICEKWNRLGQKEKFGLPTEDAMEILRIKSKNTYYAVFNDLVEWGFVKVIQKTLNQNTSTVVSLNQKMIQRKDSTYTALDLATIQHKDDTVPIIEQETIEQETINKKEILKENVEFLYSLYPSKCPEQKSSTGKCEKDKSKLEKLLETKTLDELQELIQLYVEDCIAHKRYMRNFSTFLNNLPDKESFTKQEPKTAPTSTPTKPISIVHQSFPLPPQLPGTIRFRFKDDPSNITREMEKEYGLRHIENVKGGGYIAIML